MGRLCHAGISLQDLQEDSSDSDVVAEIAPMAEEASLGTQEHVNNINAAEGNGSDESGSESFEEAGSLESSGDEDAQGLVQATAEMLPVAGPAPLQIQAG